MAINVGAGGELIPITTTVGFGAGQGMARQGFDKERLEFAGEKELSDQRFEQQKGLVDYKFTAQQKAQIQKHQNNLAQIDEALANKTIDQYEAEQAKKQELERMMGIKKIPSMIKEPTAQEVFNSRIVEVDGRKGLFDPKTGKFDPLDDGSSAKTGPTTKEVADIWKTGMEMFGGDMAKAAEYVQSVISGKYTTPAEEKPNFLEELFGEAPIAVASAATGLPLGAGDTVGGEERTIQGYPSFGGGGAVAPPAATQQVEGQKMQTAASERPVAGQENPSPKLVKRTEKEEAALEMEYSEQNVRKLFDNAGLDERLWEGVKVAMDKYKDPNASTAERIAAWRRFQRVHARLKSFATGKSGLVESI